MPLPRYRLLPRQSAQRHAVRFDFLRLGRDYFPYQYDGMQRPPPLSLIHIRLYFAGEVLDIDADTGGYNLQIAYSTGHLAGELKP